MIARLTLEQKLQAVILALICFVAVADYLIKKFNDMVRRKKVYNQIVHLFCFGESPKDRKSGSPKVK